MDVSTKNNDCIDGRDSHFCRLKNFIKSQNSYVGISLYEPPEASI